MKIKEWKIPATALALMAAAAVFLSWWSANQRLGRPGIQTTSAGEAGELKIEFPQHVLDYVGEDRLIPDGIKDALPPDTTIAVRDYTATDEFWVRLMGVLMGTDRTSIHQPEFCLKASGFKIIGSELDVISIVGPNPYELPVTILRTESEHKGVKYPGFYVYWFVADGLATAQHWERMWWMAKGLFATGELQRWAYVSCLARTRPGNEKACLKRVKEFLAHAIPDFQPRPQSLAKEKGRKVAAAAEE